MGVASFMLQHIMRYERLETVHIASRLSRETSDEKVCSVPVPAPKLVFVFES